jgi:hypothetical protein
VDDAWLTYETFAPLVGSKFTLRTANGADVPLTLAEANDTGIPGGTGPDGETRTQFSLVFRGPADVPLEQGTYEVDADAVGIQTLFIVPIRADSDGRYYEAVFA